MFILSFSIPFPCLVVILLILCVIPLWDSARAQPFLSGRYPFFKAFHICKLISTLSCVIPLWDSVTAHSPSSKELHLSSQEDTRFLGRCTLAYTFHFILHHPSFGLSNSSLTLQYRAHILSSLEESCFSGLIVLLMLSHYPAWALFGLYSLILLIKSINACIVFAVYFYSESPPLRNILFYV